VHPSSHLLTAHWRAIRSRRTSSTYELADLMVLNSNPLENIRNTLDSNYVMKGGKPYDAMSLDEIWPKALQFGPYYWVNDDVLQQNTKDSGTFDKKP
jgi:hypothetical protein